MIKFIKFKVDNKNIRKESIKIKVSSKQTYIRRTPEKYLSQVLDMLKVVNKETVSTVNF